MISYLSYYLIMFKGSTFISNKQVFNELLYKPQLFWMKFIKWLIFELSESRFSLDNDEIYVLKRIIILVNFEEYV